MVSPLCLNLMIVNRVAEVSALAASFVFAFAAVGHCRLGLYRCALVYGAIPIVSIVDSLFALHAVKSIAVMI